MAGTAMLRKLVMTDALERYNVVWESPSRDSSGSMPIGNLFRALGGKDPYPTVVSPDVVPPARGGRVTWFHHNEKRANDGYEINLRLQGLGEMIDRMPHPLLGRTFGAAMEGDDFLAA